MKLLFMREGIGRVAGVCGLAAGVCLPSPHPALAETAAKRFLVTEEMVVAAMQYRQLPVEGVQVKLSAPITALSSNPMLEIQAVTVSNSHSAQLRVACRNRTECLPFYAAATWPSTSEGVSQPAMAAHLETPGSLVNQSATHPDRLLKAGSEATLLIEDKKVHIRLHVVCLEGGSTGDTVRVATADHKLTYKAEIIAPNLLKGIF